MSKKHSEKFEWMSTREICVHLSISSRTLDRYRKRPDGSNPFPEPDCSFMGGSNKWLTTRVTEWQIREMSRQTRRPMSHLNVARDSKGRIIRPDAA
ncbi:excisionase Xis [Phytobacter palmae]|uniref:Excisionase Xis n=1 Tax=Phytobacter palmae TaxID=1855371 RepID=A0ABU9VB36_9ENTR